MSKASSVNESDATTDDEPNLTDARYTRALTERMAVDRFGPGIYDIHHGEKTYRVELESVHCECPDCEYRGRGCKHVIRAAIHALYADGSHYRFVADVARFACEHGCPHGASGCNGPLALDDAGVIPCEDCITVTPGHWTVWCRLTGNDDKLALGTAAENSVATDEESAETVAMTDGGTDTDDDLETAYRAVCHDCSWSRQRRDVVAADDLGGEHAAEAGHFTEVKETEVAAQPARSEQPDFGHGDSTGPELL